jgi:hypothetical protein
LHRYPAEVDFRYNDRIALGVKDNERAERLAKGIVGKRLTYRRRNEQDIPFYGQAFSALAQEALEAQTP